MRPTQSDLSQTSVSEDILGAFEHAGALKASSAFLREDLIACNSCHKNKQAGQGQTATDASGQRASKAEKSINTGKSLSDEADESTAKPFDINRDLRQTVQGSDTVVFVLDISKSTGEKIKVEIAGKTVEVTKFDLEMHALKQAMMRVPYGTNIMLRVFGGAVEGEDECLQSKLLDGPQPMDFKRTHFADEIKNLGPAIHGLTPLTFAIEETYKDVEHIPGKKTVFLITDGENKCGEHPCTSITRLHNDDPSVEIFSIGLGVSDTGLGQLACYAETTGGKVLNLPKKKKNERDADVDKKINEHLESMFAFRGVSAERLSPGFIQQPAILAKSLGSSAGSAFERYEHEPDISPKYDPKAPVKFAPPLVAQYDFGPENKPSEPKSGLSIPGSSDGKANMAAKPGKPELTRSMVGSLLREAQADKKYCVESSKMVFPRNQDLLKRFEDLQEMLGRLKTGLVKCSVPDSYTAAQDALSEAEADVKHAQHYNADYISDSKITKTPAGHIENTQTVQDYLDELIYNLESVSLEDRLKP